MRLIWSMKNNITEAYSLKTNTIADPIIDQLNQKYRFNIESTTYQKIDEKISDLAKSNDIDTDLTDLVYRLCVYGKNYHGQFLRYLNKTVIDISKSIL